VHGQQFNAGFVNECQLTAPSMVQQA
jgi:hypothetical protein